jgi:hypothetical protein
VISNPSDVFAHLSGKRWQWAVLLPGGVFTGQFTYTSRAGALKAGKRSFAKLKRYMTAGDMP